jgi:hypothetical protein
MAKLTPDEQMAQWEQPRELAEIKLTKTLKETLSGPPFRFSERRVDKIVQNTMKMVRAALIGPAP